MSFQHSHDLSGIHKKRIRWLEFSPKTPSLASGDEGGIVVVWDIHTGLARATLDLKEPITVFAWDRKKKDRLFVGLSTGAVCVIEELKIQGTFVKTGVTGASVHAIASSPSGRIAMAIGSEVHIAHELEHGGWATIDILPAPASFRDFDADARLRPRSLHFHNGSSKLIVSYLNHGIVCWDLSLLTQLWEIPPNESQLNIGYSTYLPQLSVIAATNMSTGVVMYSLKSRKLIGEHEVPLQADRNVPINIANLNDSGRVVSGGHDGSIFVWEIESNELSQQGTLD
ncbi:WD40-repeat-containing domain protein [Ephemerocybe angulata]|uniref:WD40-repeat-containing domain protein n=1 Tax=Ephemerocybe angulata TaxID=980116 RepID=A0A8H6H7V3_9AGAR|nr:WD40-repeat-containing domain protein [Tulosesus angulatus]